MPENTNAQQFVTSHEPIELRDVAVLRGDETILDGVTVRDFWAWALGDLRLNSNRGMLAQFLVAKALGDIRLRDDGWGNYDVLTQDGIKVEVKSSGYLQSWAQKSLSKIIFSGLKARSWGAMAGYSAEAEFRVDVYVFAVHTCQDPSVYDPLLVAAWEFYVLPGARIRSLDQKTLSLKRLSSLAPPPVTLTKLQQAVSMAYELQQADVPTVEYANDGTQ